MQSTDHRLKYFNERELELIDSIAPVLEKEGLIKEAERLCSCGNKYVAFTCTEEKEHSHVEFVFPARCELRICP